MLLIKLLNLPSLLFFDKCLNVLLPNITMGISISEALNQICGWELNITFYFDIVLMQFVFVQLKL